MINTTATPLRVTSLRQACVERLEDLILSGKLKIGERLPSERELAARLEISRPVLHEAIVELAARGLVHVKPRRGVVINDFRHSGSVAILSSLLSYHGGELSPDLLASLMQMRILIETETASLAASTRTNEQMVDLQHLIEEENKTSGDQAEQLTHLDFQFHLQVALASGNLVYPLIINSFKPVYTSLTGKFFHSFSGTVVVSEVLQFHRDLVSAILERNADLARATMQMMLVHGQKHLKAQENKHARTSD